MTRISRKPQYGESLNSRQTFQMQPERFRINRSNVIDKEDIDSEHDSVNHHLDKDSIQIDYGSSRTGLTDASHQV